MPPRSSVAPRWFGLEALGPGRSWICETGAEEHELASSLALGSTAPARGSAGRTEGFLATSPANEMPVSSTPVS